MANKGNIGPCMCPGGVDNIIAIEHPVAASQYFHNAGQKFCYMDSSGYVTGNITATQYVYGWAESPVSDDTGTSNNYWVSSATAGLSKIPVISAATYPGCVFRVNTTSALSVQARVGECADLVGTNNSTIGYITPGTNTQDILIFLGIDPYLDTAVGLVTFNPEEIQRDT